MADQREKKQLLEFIQKIKKQKNRLNKYAANLWHILTLINQSCWFFLLLFAT